MININNNLTYIKLNKYNFVFKNNFTCIKLNTCNFVFKYHKIRKIWGEALSVNKNILNIHKKFGFNIEGILRRQIKKKNKYLDIVRISMFASEWQKNKKKIFNNLKMKKI